MKKDYMVSGLKPFKKAEIEVTAVLDKKIQAALQQVKESPEGSHFYVEQLHELLLKRKNISGISNELKQEIFRYFLQREIKEMNFIRLRDKHTLKILKVTKTKLKDFKLNWKDILTGFEQSNDQTQKVAGLYQFLSILRPYYDCNNVVEVFEWFKGKYNLGSEMTWFYIEKFVNITPQTDCALLGQFVVLLEEYFEMSGLKDMHLWRWLLRIKKKAHDLDMSKQMEVLTNQLLKKFMQIQNKQKTVTDVLNTKFVGTAFANLIGRKNPLSVNIIRMFFEIFKNSFVAFMESKQNVKFLAIFLTTVRDRKNAEDKLRKKITKIEESKEDEVEEQPEEESDKEDDVDESGISNLVGNFVVISESDSEEEQEEESEKSDKQLRLKKLRLRLSNQLTQDILNAIQYNMQLYLEDIFFVQSKEACKALGAAFNLFPSLAESSLELIMKGVEIPELNVPILMKMTRKVLESLLANADRSKLLSSVLDILEWTAKIRYIKDGWNTVCLVVGNIPLLDQQDCAKVEESQKEEFQKHYSMKHDQFYERYSELVFQSFKRFLSENEAKEKKRLLLQNPFNKLCTNSYKYFEKRCINYAVQLYLENQSLYIHYFLELKRIPENLLEHFVHRSLPKYKSDHLEKKLLELVLASRSINFGQLRRLIEMLCSSEVESSDVHETVRSMLDTWVFEHVYFHCSYRALKSNLEHMLPGNSHRGQYYLTNHHKQELEDRMKEIITMWEDYYAYVNKFVQDLGVSNEQSITKNLPQSITRMYFQNFDIDYTARKELLWRVRVLKIIIETFPFHRSLFAGNHLLKDIRFEEFIPMKDLRGRSVKLLERLMETVLTKFPHDRKLISVLKSFAIGLVDCEENEFYMYSMDLKDIKKLIKKSEDQDVSNYYLLNMQVDMRINLLNLAVTFGRDKELTESLFSYILALIFHPDESGIPIRDTARLNPSLIQLLFDLFRTKVPENAEENKKNKFQVRLAEILHEYIGQVKTQVTGEQLVEFISICMQMIGSAERTVREAYLSALKTLIGKIEQTHFNAKILEDKVVEGISSGNSKQKLIWSICLLAASHSGKQVDYSKFTHLFNELLFEQDFLMRKAAIFLNGFVTRTRRISSRKINKLTALPEYIRKTLEQFEDSGFLRPEHIHEHLLRKKWLRKYRSYTECEIVEKTHFPETFEFLDEPEKCVKFLRTYHTDQISSEDEVAFMTKKGSIMKEITELSDILGWVIKKYSKSVKLSKHQLSIYERLYGERFFKYLFEVDLGKGFVNTDTGCRFFKSTKDFMMECLARMETLDNQLVVSNYATMLLNAYEQVWRKQRNEDIQQFCRDAIKQLMEKSAGQFWILFCKVALNGLGQIGFITEFFESFTPTSPSYFRAVERLLIIHSNRYDKLFGILKTTIQAGHGLANPILLKNIKALISFPDKHFFDQSVAQKSGVLDTQALLKQDRLEAVSEHLAIRTNKDFQEWLLVTLSQFITSEHIDLRKIGGNLLFECINATAQLHKSANSTKLLTKLLEVAVGWMTNNREEIKTQQNKFQVSLASLLSEIYTPEEFKILLGHLVKLLVPQPQTVHYLGTLYKSPYNFMKQSEADYQKFILCLLELLENPLLYKEVLLCISGLLYYRKLGKDSLNEPFVLKTSHSQTERQQRHQILESIKSFTSNERYRLVLLMALLLADVHNLRLYDQQLEYILGGQKQKDKVKLWAKLMVESRGKAELIEDEHTKSLWNKIKSFSNPYFYHA